MKLEAAEKRIERALNRLGGMTPTELEAFFKVPMDGSNPEAHGNCYTRSNREAALNGWLNKEGQLALPNVAIELQHGKWCLSCPGLGMNQIKLEIEIPEGVQCYLLATGPSVIHVLTRNRLRYQAITLVAYEALISHEGVLPLAEVCRRIDRSTVLEDALETPFGNTLEGVLELVSVTYDSTRLEQLEQLGVFLADVHNFHRSIFSLRY